MFSFLFFLTFLFFGRRNVSVLFIHYFLFLDSPLLFHSSVFVLCLVPSSSLVFHYFTFYFLLTSISSPFYYLSLHIRPFTLHTCSFLFAGNLYNFHSVTSYSSSSLPLYPSPSIILPSLYIATLSHPSTPVIFFLQVANIIQLPYNLLPFPYSSFPYSPLPSSSLPP